MSRSVVCCQTATVLNIFGVEVRVRLYKCKDERFQGSGGEQIVAIFLQINYVVSGLHWKLAVT